MTFFTDLEQIILKLYGIIKGPESGLKKKTKAGGITFPDFRQYHKAPVIKTPWNLHKTNRSMEQNRESRNKPTHLQSINLQQRRQEYPMGKRQSFQQVVLEKLDSCMYINEVGTYPLTTHKNKLKMA